MKILNLKYAGEQIIAMGDVIDCVGLINYLSLKEPYMLPCMGHSNYLANFKTFFADNSNINIFGIENFPHIQRIASINGQLLIEGQENHGKEFMMTTVYNAGGLRYADRCKYCDFAALAKRVPQLPVPDRPYAFVPEGGSTGGYRISRKYITDSLLVVTPPQNAIMLSYADIIAKAPEIHCHTTSWQRLIDYLPTKGKLFLHHYCRPYGDPKLWRKLGMIDKNWHQII